MASQTTPWIVRQTILPRVYATPPPLTNIDAIARFPEHVRRFVRNLWLEDPRTFSDACTRQAL
ncbi:uncharacterized protein LAESUDRAFT_718925 [Laetiporus sulphureus 93-53]|uniref:Uncharacterized protein n=1 Tax=Laetiporus sulphureus 93-53 TaxID=1314785 RepID=A0A165I662_9APHY|nr:uncharacterized protein LAESUDRAFT_718925 [Laetiporus sulphureus 93-53]KZT12644.1 hypothetical protein LAESUDRAFT_718925 [Laetiporus sulphureus 93-53]